MQLAGVQYILDTVVNELWANKDRRFSYGEMVRILRHVSAKLSDDCFLDRTFLQELSAMHASET